MKYITSVWEQGTRKHAENLNNTGLGEKGRGHACTGITPRRNSHCDRYLNNEGQE
jgi:hypothetical protein